MEEGLWWVDEGGVEVDGWRRGCGGWMEEGLRWMDGGGVVVDG